MLLVWTRLLLLHQIYFSPRVESIWMSTCSCWVNLICSSCQRLQREEPCPGHPQRVICCTDTPVKYLFLWHYWRFSVYFNLTSGFFAAFSNVWFQLNISCVNVPFQICFDISLLQVLTCMLYSDTALPSSSVSLSFVICKSCCVNKYYLGIFWKRGDVCDLLQTSNGSLFSSKTQSLRFWYPLKCLSVAEQGVGELLSPLPTLWPRSLWPSELNISA